MLDSKQENGFFVLLFPNRGVELHSYALDTGAKNYIYEYQLTTIEAVQDGKYYNDYFWIIGSQTTGQCFLIKLSKTRRYVYLCPANNKFSNIVFPGSNPILSGYDTSFQPFLLQVGETDFATKWNVRLKNITSSIMAMVNRNEGDTMLTLAMSDTVDNSVYVTVINGNSTSLSWSQKYSQKLTNLNLRYTSVFSEYVLVGYDATKNRHCFMRFDSNSGRQSFLKCTADASATTYNIYTSSLHIDSGTTIYMGGQLKAENFFFYRTGVELGDASCMFTGSSFYTSSDYSHSKSYISTEDLSMTMTSHTSKFL